MFVFFIAFVVLFLLLCSAFFSACETAITASSTAKFHQLSKEGNKKATIIRGLQKKLGLVVSVLLACNTMTNTWCVSLITTLVVGLTEKGGLSTFFLSLLMGGLILIYAEVMPKMFAIYRPEAFLLFSANFLRIIVNIFQPINKAVNSIAYKTLAIFGCRPEDKNREYMSIEELKGAIDLHKGTSQDAPQERAMLKSILDLGSVQIEDIMVHRKNVTMLNADEPLEVIIDQLLSCPYTRFPLWRGNTDNIIGIINAKALWKAIRLHKDSIKGIDLIKIAYKPWFIPESTDLLEQLQAFRQRREHFALVVDEYGGFMGIVTLEDILEEIVGDIADEHDITTKGIQPQDDGSYLINGSVTIRDLNRQFEWNLPDDTAATIAGLLLESIRIIPKVGQIFVLHGFRFEVIRRQRNHISLLKLTPLDANKD